jgi:MFS family permease
VASLLGPAAGGFITDHFSWRWLFFVNVPFAVLTLVVVAAYMHVSRDAKKHSIDVAGSVTLSIGITCALLAIVWGGGQYAWNSWEIVALFSSAVAMLAAFCWFETRAPEPVLPLGLWRSSIFTLSNIAGMCVATTMFGAIFFIPIFVQGVLANSVTSSGAILVPMLLAMILTSIGNGQLMSRTGYYKVPLLAGLALMGAGFVMLSYLDFQSTNQTVVAAMILVGLGMGIAMQTYTVVVQNSVSRAEMAVATSATQLSRSFGAAIGLAVMGNVLAQGLAASVTRYVPPEALSKFIAAGNTVTAGAIFDPAQLARLPPTIALGIRHGLADAMHPVFLIGLPVIALAFIATLFIKELPLRQTAHVAAGKPLTSSP